MELSRAAGVLLHPTSLPNNGKLGCLNEQAGLFLDWMVDAGLKVWQMLPLTEPVQGLSPYQSVSAFAMNPGLLPCDWQANWDEKGFQAFLKTPPHWLEDYTLFMALRKHYDYRTWAHWPEEHKTRDKKALAAFAKLHAAEVLLLNQQQFALATLWQKIKKEANAKGIKLFGDMPIFVAYDSADVWASPDQFKLDAAGNPTVVAGVPPDYFSATGQRWGNPHYCWDTMEKDGFNWWVKRVEEALSQFDLVRIDHFRGFDAVWEIKATEETAINGEWVKVPGAALLTALRANFPELPLVAEDLGVITPEVIKLKNTFKLPGMSVLQFGFNGLPDNPHSLEEQVESSFVYTGTHDNDTTLGWWNERTDKSAKTWIASKLCRDCGEMPWPLIDAGMKSPAVMMIAPMQDFLSLDNKSRMNIPGTADGNWDWQFDWAQVTSDIAPKIKKMIAASKR